MGSYHSRRVPAAAAAVAVAVAGTGCTADPPPAVLPLEIGVAAADNSFHLLAEGEDVSLTSVIMGATMIALRLHFPPEVAALDDLVDLEVDAERDGTLVGALLAAGPPPVFDPATRLLSGVQVYLQVEACCVNCAELALSARATDLSGRTYEGAVTVRASRFGCPDPMVCCPDASYCPVAAWALVCI